MKLAAVSQFDFSNKENPEANTFLDKNLSSGELRFYKELFWRTKTTKTGDEGFILSPYLESKAKDYRQATATLEAILVTNANQRLKDILAGSGDKNAEMDKLIKQVKSERDERVANWFGRDKNDIVSQMATLVTRQGYLQDFSFMHAYRYCWGYIFEADSDGNPTGIKKVDTGGVNTPSGDLPSLYWARRAHNYDLQSNSRTQFLPPTQTDMRLKLRKDPLGEMDKYKPEDHDDAFLRKQWDRMFDKKFRNHRKSRGYPEELPEELAKALKNSAWIWRLPYSSTHVGESNKYPLDIVMFFPHNFDTANFFENASIVEGDKRATLWKKSALEGVPLSKIPWQEIDMQQVDNHLVNLEMGSRYMRTLIENFDEERDPFYSLVMRAPSTMGPKEAAKRLRLALRHNPDESSSVAELQFIPWYITQGVASKHRIIHPDAWERSTVTSEETKKVGYNRIDLFLEEMAYWRRAFWWLPGERGIAGPDGGEDLWGGGEFSLPEEGGEYTHYGRTMAMLGEYYQNVFIRWARASAEEAYPLTPGFYNTTREEYMKDKDYKFLLGKAAVHPYEPSHRALRR
ncbi:CHASE3 domain-containing protein, partial [Patescibacteria group bacterium]|nr:CHASE3 domain-containing protein [Patescibacteria group bacterium]